jgi:hypothetical protein
VVASTVDLWLLQDYKHVVWVHKYCVELPVMEINHFEEDEYWYLHILYFYPEQEMCWLMALTGSCTMTSRAICCRSSSVIVTGWTSGIGRY